MPKSKARQEIAQSKQQQKEARLAEYAPTKNGRRARREEARRWAKVLRERNKGLQPTTNAARASLAHDRRREREEAKRKHPVIVSQGCTCPRLCDLHPIT